MTNRFGCFHLFAVAPSTILLLITINFGLGDGFSLPPLLPFLIRFRIVGAFPVGTGASDTVGCMLISTFDCGQRFGASFIC